MTIAVAGVTGRTGAVVADELLSHGLEVRVIVRDEGKVGPWLARGAAWAVADLTDRNALVQAFDGVTSAYLLLPDNPVAVDFAAEKAQMTRAVAEAVQHTESLRHVVFLSAIGAHSRETAHGIPRSLFEAERRLEAIDEVAWTFLRASSFTDGLRTVLPATANGVLPSFLRADQKVDMICCADVGRLAAELLMTGPVSAGIVEAGGPAVSMNDVARVVTKITGKPVHVSEIPPDAFVPTMLGSGASASFAELFREMMLAVREGRVSWEGGHRRVLGSTALETSLRTWMAV